MTQVYVAGKWIELAEGESITVTGDGKGNLSEASTTPALTPASVAAMSDRELDEALASLLGYTFEPEDDNDFIDGHWFAPGETIGRADGLPAYSTDPAAAAEAVAAVMAKGWAMAHYTPGNEFQGEILDGHMVWFWHSEGRTQSHYLGTVHAVAKTETRAKAECAALALAAMKENK